MSSKFIFYLHNTKVCIFKQYSMSKFKVEIELEFNDCLALELDLTYVSEKETQMKPFEKTGKANR